jgi:sulfatase maturation enzyme AslB (radical SAM superfamily)
MKGLKLWQAIKGAMCLENMQRVRQSKRKAVFIAEKLTREANRIMSTHLFRHHKAQFLAQSFLIRHIFLIRFLSKMENTRWNTVLALLLIPLVLFARSRAWRRRGPIPVSVNYHFTRRCNKTCGFCFHTATTSHIEDSSRAKQCLRLLTAAGMRNINFAGGEPFLYPKFLGELIDFCKEELHLESVSIVTNGSLVKANFLAQHAKNLDILAVSCDSFNATLPSVGARVTRFRSSTRSETGAVSITSSSRSTRLSTG